MILMTYTAEKLEDCRRNEQKNITQMSKIWKYPRMYKSTHRAFLQLQQRQLRAVISLANHTDLIPVFILIFFSK